MQPPCSADRCLERLCFLRTSDEAARQKLGVIGVTNVPLLSQAAWGTGSEDISLVQDLDQKPDEISPCSIFVVVH